MIGERKTTLREAGHTSFVLWTVKDVSDFVDFCKCFICSLVVMSAVLQWNSLIHVCTYL
jgi:hypothetical protein